MMDPDDPGTSSQSRQPSPFQIIKIPTMTSVLNLCKKVGGKNAHMAALESNLVFPVVVNPASEYENVGYVISCSMNK
jgi:hypothetical protein